MTITSLAPGSTDAGSLALGNGAVSTGPGSVALGQGSTDGDASRVVSVGGVGGERRISNVAPGTSDTDAANIAQLQAVTTTFGATTAGLQGQIDSVNFDLRQARRRSSASRPR